MSSPALPRLYGGLKKTNSDTSIPLPRAGDSAASRRFNQLPNGEIDKQHRVRYVRKIFKGLRTVELTEDHKAISEKERKRMKLKGGFVVNGRVFGVLAVRIDYFDKRVTKI